MNQEREMRQKIVALIETGDKANLELAQLLCAGQGLPFQKLFRDAWGELLLAYECTPSPKHLAWLMGEKSFNFRVVGNTLPRGLESLTNLDSLTMYGNLPNLPDLRKLVNLQSFTVCTELTELPAWIGELAGLRYLYCSGNQLTELPESLGKLKNLQYLYLENNKICALPKSLAQLTKLQLLNCGNNKLTEMPTWIEGSTSLRSVSFEGNLF